jgi:hypothetical protein
LAGVLCGEPGQGGQALLEGVLVVFDEPVGEQDEGGAAGELMVQVSAGSAAVDAEGEPGSASRYRVGSPGTRSSGARWLGVLERRSHPAPAGKAGGGERSVVHGLERAVQLGEHGAGRAAPLVQEGVQHRPGLLRQITPTRHW